MYNTAHDTSTVVTCEFNVRWGVLIYINSLLLIYALTCLFKVYSINIQMIYSNILSTVVHILLL